MQVYSPQELLQLVPFLLEEEYQIKLEELQCIYIKENIERCVTDFYKTLNATKGFGRYDEKKRNHSFCTSKCGYDLYLECIAKKVALHAVTFHYPILRRPFSIRKSGIVWEQVIVII